MGKEEKRPKYLDQEKYDYIQNYLEQAREETKDGDSHSVTTDTSDSGMLRSNSASSDVGTEDTSGKHIRFLTSLVKILYRNQLLVIFILLPLTGKPNITVLTTI